MKTAQSLGFKLFLLGCAFGLLAPTAILAADGEITAVCSRVSDDYIRTTLPSGTFESETYAFGEGGNWRGTMKDASIDNLKFIDIARTISQPLGEKNFIPAKDPAKTKLLIMVYWGTTAGSAEASDSMAYRSMGQSNGRLINAQGALAAAQSAVKRGVQSDSAEAQREADAAGDAFNSALMIAAMENRQRDRNNVRNAGMLGYDSTGTIGTDYGRNNALTAFRGRLQDLIEDIEENRYFVVLMAYDFQLMWKDKKPKLLWETRYSIRQHGNNFNEQLASMTESASRYFGHESHGLIRKPLRQESIKLDAIKILDDDVDRK